ncbi:MAG: hypothetical protein QW067_10330 [Thermofilaceae archaeon]
MILENVRLGEPVKVIVNPKEGTINIIEKALEFDLQDFIETIEELINGKKQDEILEDTESNPVFIERYKDWIIFHLANSYMIFSIEDMKKLVEYVKNEREKYEGGEK